MADKFSLTAQINLQAPKNTKQIYNQIQKQLKNISINVDLTNARKAVQDITKITKAQKQLEVQSKKTATGADKMGKAFGSALKNVLRYDLARRVFSAFANTVEQGIGDAIRFNREMVKVAQVGNQTMKSLKGLTTEIRTLSKELGVSSMSLAKISVILKQTGIATKEVQVALRALALTDLAPTFDNLADTTETAVAAMRQFKIEAKGFEGLFDKINRVAGSFAVEASDIGVAIKRAGGAFRTAGGSVEELIALFTSVRATTRETAETIATGFRTIFTRLQRPTTIKFLKQFGIELQDLSGKFVGPFEAVKALNIALKDLDPKDLRYSMIIEQLGGFRQVSKVIPLIQEVGTAQKVLNEQQRATGSLAKDAGKAQETLAVKMQKLTEQVKELFAEMANSTAFQTLASAAIAFAEAMTKVGKTLAPILPIIGAVLALKAAKWTSGKLISGGVGGLNSALGSSMGDTTSVYGANRGGKVPKRFSRGGWVPGTGNGDTVPALLEPGEFVLRKSAAQAFGSRLNGINKFKRGGVAKVTSVNSVTDGDSFNIDSIPDNGSENSSSRLQGFDAAELPKNTIGQGNAKKLFKEKGLTHPGIIAKDIAQKYFDQRGQGMRHQFFEDPFGKRIPYGRSSDQSQRPLFSAPGLGDALIAAGVGVGGGSSAKFSMRDYVEKNHPELLGQNLDAGDKSQQFNKGGLVRALLTPGEFVVNKRSAQRMGYGKLRSMNKYAGGGKVQRFSGGGGVTSGGGADSFGRLDSAIIKTTGAFTSATSMAMELGTSFKQVASIGLDLFGAFTQGYAIFNSLTASVSAGIQSIVGESPAVESAFGAIGSLGGRVAGAVTAFKSLEGLEQYVNKGISSGGGQLNATGAIKSSFTGTQSKIPGIARLSKWSESAAKAAEKNATLASEQVKKIETLRKVAYEGSVAEKKLTSVNQKISLRQMGLNITNKEILRAQGDKELLAELAETGKTAVKDEANTRRNFKALEDRSKLHTKTIAEKLDQMDEARTLAKEAGDKVAPQRATAAVNRAKAAPLIDQARTYRQAADTATARAGEHFAASRQATGKQGLRGPVQKYLGNQQLAAAEQANLANQNVTREVAPLMDEARSLEAKADINEITASDADDKVKKLGESVEDLHRRNGNLAKEMSNLDDAIEKSIKVQNETADDIAKISKKYYAGTGHPSGVEATDEAISSRIDNLEAKKITQETKIGKMQAGVAASGLEETAEAGAKASKGLPGAAQAAKQMEKVAKSSAILAKGIKAASIALRGLILAAPMIAEILLKELGGAMRETALATIQTADSFTAASEAQLASELVTGTLMETTGKLIGYFGLLGVSIMILNAVTKALAASKFAENAIVKGMVAVQAFLATSALGAGMSLMGVAIPAWAVVAALFALIGGILLVVAYFSAAAEAAREIEKAKFGQKLSNLGDAIDKFKKGIGSVEDVRRSAMGVKAGMSDYKTMSEEERAEATAKIQDAGQIVFDDIGSRAGGDQDKADELFKQFQTDFGEFYDADTMGQFKDALDRGVESAQKMAAMAALMRDRAKELIRLKDLSKVFDEASFRVQHFSDIIDAAADPLSGGNIRSLADNLRSEQGDPESIKRFNQAIDSIAVRGGIAGEDQRFGLGNFAEKAKTAGFISRSAESSVIAAQADADSLGEGGAASAVMRQFELAAEAEGFDFDGPLKKKMEEYLGAFDEDELKKMLLEDPDKLGKLLEDQVSGFTDVFADAYKAIDSHNDKLAAAYAQQRAIQQEYIQQQLDIVNASMDAQQRFNEAGRTRDTQGIGQDQALIDQRLAAQNQALASAASDDVKGVVATGGVEGVAEAFAATREKLDASNEAIAKMEEKMRAGVGADDPLQSATDGAVESLKQLKQQNEALKNDYEALQNVLGNYADIQDRLNAKLREQEQLGKKRKTLKQLTQDARYGTAEQKEESQRLINAIQIARTEGIDAVAPELQRTVIPYLEAIDGDAGAQRTEDGMNQWLADMGGATIGPNGVAGVTAISDQEEKLRQEIFALEQEALKAQQALADNTKTGLDKVSENINTLNETFKEEIRNLLAQSAIREGKKDVSAKKTEEEKLQRQKNQLGEIAAAQLGVTLADEGPERQAQLDKAYKDFFVDDPQGQKRLEFLQDNQNDLDKITEGDTVQSQASQAIIGAKDNLALHKRKTVESQFRDADVSTEDFDAMFAPYLKGFEGSLYDTMVTTADNVGGDWGGAEFQINELESSSGSYDASVENEELPAYNKMKDALRARAMELGISAQEFQAQVQKSIDQKHNIDQFMQGMVSMMDNVAMSQVGSANEALDEAEGLGFTASGLQETGNLAGSATAGIEAITAEAAAGMGLTPDKSLEGKMEKAQQATIDSKTALEKLVKAGVEQENSIAVKNNHSDGHIAEINATAKAILALMGGTAGSTAASVGATGGATSGGFSDKIKAALSSGGGAGIGSATPEEKAAVQAALAEISGMAGGVSIDPKDPSGSFASIMRGSGGGTSNMLPIEKIKGQIAKLTDADYEAIAATADKYNLGGMSNNITSMLGDVSGLQGGSLNERGRQRLQEEGLGDLASQATALQNRKAGAGASSSGTMSVDSSGFGASVERFSQNLGEVSAMLGNPLTIEIGGTIDMNVNLNGAEFLKDAQDGFTKLAGKQVTAGINNFIKHGLKNQQVKEKGDWVDVGGDSGGKGLAGAGKSSTS